MKKVYYIVNWRRECWNTFLQHQIEITKYYKLREGFIEVSDYRENPNDSYYMSDAIYTRKDFCFKIKDKCDIFLSLDEARTYALQKLDEMYLSRCNYLVKERDEAIQKIKEK